MRKNVLFYLSLIIAFLLVWLWAAINPIYPHDWLLENYLVFLFVPIIILTGIYFRLSKLSYVLITIFMCLHVIGSHYTYAEVPFGETLRIWFHGDRNMYDRLVHFCFGFLLAYPIREVFVRLSRAKGFWGLWFPVELTLAFSAIYEIIEWVTSIGVDPAAGLAFLGAQGDIWDAQKDMLMAGIGAVITMVVTAVVRLSVDSHFPTEFKESFKISRSDAPMGEVAIAKLSNKRKR